MNVVERIVSVARDYRHSSKLVRPGPRLTLDGTVLKWYDIAPANAPVPDDVRRQARADLRAASKSGAVDALGELGFVILHRCGDGFYFLLVSTWRNDNELWETVWAKGGEEDESFRPWRIGGAHRPTFCVWELAVVAHERLAWTRYLLSGRDEHAKQRYVRSVYEGDA